MCQINIEILSMKGDILIKNISLALEDKIYLITGKNGVGKTTLLNTLYMLHTEYIGEIIFNNINIKSISKYNIRNKYISYTSQYDKFFENLTIKENINIMNKDKFKIIIDEFSTFYNIDVNTKIKSLSGGQRQLLNILINLNKNVEIYLIDEPFNNLDKAKQEFIINKIRELKKTVLLIDHKKLIQDNIIKIENRKCELNV